MKRRKIDYSDSQTSGSSIADLPEDNFYGIMLRLSVRSIVISKSVCKTWHVLISNPRFAKQHLAQAKPCPLIRDRQVSRFSRAVYILEHVGEGDFGAGCCSCYSSMKVRNRCRCTMKVKSKMKIPIRNKDSLVGQVKGDITSVVFGMNGGCKRNNYQKVSTESVWEHVFVDVKSCNGLLCLSCYTEKRVIVCNPITGEYIFLPDRLNENNTSFFDVYFGFSPKSNQYKVLRVVRNGAIDIYSLGTRTWKSIGLWKFQPIHGNSYLCLNGVLHWVCSGNNTSSSRHITCFDLDEERFRSHSLPIPNSLSECSNHMTLRLLGDRLCLYNHIYPYDLDGRIDVWAMEEYGLAESWTRLVSINISRRMKWEVTTISSFQPPSRSTDGTILLLDRHNTLIYCDRWGVFRCKHLRSRGIISEFEAIAHIPSFASLKDMVDTTDLEVSNVYSGCGKIQLMEENYPVYLACGKKDYEYA